MPKITLIGPLSEDTIIKGNSCYQAAGGAVFYQANVLSNLKIDTDAFITLSNINLLKELSSNVNIIPLCVNEAIKFKNIYTDDDPNHRVQKAIMPQNPINIRPFLNQIKDSDAILLGPLSPYDIPFKTVESLSKLDIPLYLGAQGYLRYKVNDKIILKPWKEFKEFLKLVNFLFIDEKESAIILGKKRSLEETARALASFGPQEVIITCGNRGSLIYSGDRIYKIPAFKSKKVEDPTGLGDTYMAAYAARKLEVEDPKKCGMFAAATASLKLENKGPFKEKRNSIEARCIKGN